MSCSFLITHTHNFLLRCGPGTTILDSYGFHVHKRYPFIAGVCNFLFHYLKLRLLSASTDQQAYKKPYLYRLKISEQHGRRQTPSLHPLQTYPRPPTKAHSNISLWSSSSSTNPRQLGSRFKLCRHSRVHLPQSPALLPHIERALGHLHLLCRSWLLALRSR